MDLAQPAGAADWAATGAMGPNAAYRNQTLQYGDVELTFDESVDFGAVKRLWITATFASLLVFLLFGALPALFAGDPENLSPGLVIAFIVFWVTLLFTRFNEPISEWKTLLEDKAAASSSAYAAVYGSLSRRRIPVTAVPARVRSDITPEVVHNRLVVTSGRYVAYVTVFAYGTSLYVGWTMWRSRPGAVVIGHFVKDLIGSLVNRAGTLNQMLRTDRPRAMREAVHSAAREGVEIAIQGIEVPLASTFGQEPPIQTAPASTGPAAPPTPPAPPTFGHAPGTVPGAAPAGPMPPGTPPMGPPAPPHPSAPQTNGWNGS
ncbi:MULTISPECIES: adhesin [Streptomyces]|uniref:adhesin n=1 Tax=Streptomyces TaxID=1883 RepID=UPI0012FE9EB0|nr:adhesin [Streptomyces durhamensis]